MLADIGFLGCQCFKVYSFRAQDIKVSGIRKIGSGAVIQAATMTTVGQLRVGSEVAAAYARNTARTHRLQ